MDIKIKVEFYFNTTFWNPRAEGLKLSEFKQNNSLALPKETLEWKELI